MARQGRIKSETDYYHIIMRGNNKSNIFDNKESKRYFIDCMKNLEDEGELKLVAWCLMDNHVHLVAKVSPEKLETAFKRLNIKYAMFYHRKNNSTGHVFQGRFKSDPIESDESLINVIRYVHNNPVKAKLVKKPMDYQWSSYQDYLKQPSKDITGFVWRLFSQNNASYKKFHEIEDDQEYMEIKEDQEKFRKEKAKKSIEEVCYKYGLVDSKEITEKPYIFEEVIVAIGKKSNMSGRMIGKLVGVSEATVRRIKARSDIK